MSAVYGQVLLIVMILIFQRIVFVTESDIDFECTWSCGMFYSLIFYKLLSCLFIKFYQSVLFQNASLVFMEPIVTLYVNIVKNLLMVGGSQMDTACMVVKIINGRNQCVLVGISSNLF